MTDVFVTADHGFSTIDKHSATSAAVRYAATGAAPAASTSPPSALPHDLPPGFVAVDIADALKLPLTDANTQKLVDFAKDEHSVAGNGYIGSDPAHPDVIVASNGGSDEIWLPGANAGALAQRIVPILAGEDYTSGIFVDDRLGDIAGTLPMSAIGLRGSARTLQPSIVVNFRSSLVPDCKPVLLCAAEVADTSLETGQGMHGSFSRADTRNFMAAMGPDFKAGFADTAPSGNADIAPTLAHILKLAVPTKGRLIGRVLTEALPRGKAVNVSRGWLASKVDAAGHKTVLNISRLAARGTSMLRAIRGAVWDWRPTDFSQRPSCEIRYSLGMRIVDTTADLEQLVGNWNRSPTSRWTPSSCATRPTGRSCA